MARFGFIHQTKTKTIPTSARRAMVSGCSTAELNQCTAFTVQGVAQLGHIRGGHLRYGLQMGIWNAWLNAGFDVNH